MMHRIDDVGDEWSSFLVSDELTVQHSHAGMSSSPVSYSDTLPKPQ